MENVVENISDEGEISTNFPSAENWTTQSNNNPNNSTLLFIAVEFDTDTSFSPPPVTYSEFDQHVSPLDPNMSSTARYSPVYSDSVENTYNKVDNTYNNPVVVLQDTVNPLISSEICQSSSPTFINSTSNQNSYLASPQSPLESIENSLTNAENTLLRQVVANRYLQLVNNGGNIGEVVDSPDIDDTNQQEGTLNIDYGQGTADDDGQIIDKELQLVQFPVDNFQQNLSMVDDRNLKIDPDQVELLITVQNTDGISYSGYVSQDFLVSRSSLPSLPEDEQQLNNVLNSLESHGIVMETEENGNICEVNVQNSTLSMTDGQMMLQDPLLDPDLLLQAPVEIALDDNVLNNANNLVLKSDISQNDQLLHPLSPNVSPADALTAMGLNILPSNGIITNQCDVSVKTEIIEYEDENLLYEEQELRRSKRMMGREGNDDDEQILNRVQTISDKPVPSRARATLPASYLVINKLSNSENAKTEYGVFARKMIPKRTQFGPLEGILLNIPETALLDKNDDEFKLLFESETGTMHKLDISDENTSNWMRFVRPANNYNDQNLVLSQKGLNLYYTTTKAILPRQELQVGYSASYATKRKLKTLEPVLKEENSWPCFECLQKFATSEELQKHLNVHDEHKEEIKPRVKKLNRRSAVKCPFCTRGFLRRHSLNRHLLQHTNPNIFRERQLRQIRRTNVCTENIDKNLEWKCDICCLYFPNPSLLNLHELSHKSEHSETITGLPLDLGSGCNQGEFLIHSGDVQCPECGTEFPSRKMLIEHVTSHGKTQSDEESITVHAGPMNKNYKCYMCYKSFASRDRLARHMLVHGSEESKPLKCETCSKRFLNNSALSCHIKTHKLDKKIFECPICKNSFEHILLLKEHVRVHCIDGQYTCPHCNKIFKEYSIIRKHIRAFHCDRKHGCQYCGKPFPTLDKLRMHLLKHSDHREFLCSECGKQFKRKDKLKEHMKRMHAGDREPRFTLPRPPKPNGGVKKFMPKVQPTDYHRFIYKCHSCLLGFKRRGMLVNHLAKRHPDISPDSVPELNLPILKTTRDYYCQYCEKVYKSSSKRKGHILKNHPGAELPMSNRRKGGIPDIPGLPNPTFSQTVGSVTTNPHSCQWCHKQYASKAKLLQHQRKKHLDMLPSNTHTHAHARAHGNTLPHSPGIPEEGKYMNSPDIPDAAIGNTVLTDEVLTEVTEDQLQALTNSGYIHCDDTKFIISSNGLKQSYKLSDDTLLSQAVEELEECRSSTATSTSAYYRLIQMPSGHITISPEENVDDPPEPSRLYRLLTTNGPFPPYPPR